MENYDIWPNSIAFADDTIYGVDGERLVIDRYRDSLEKLEVPRGFVDLAIEAADGTLYVATMEGVDRLGENMAVFENVMKGSYYSYGDPGCRVQEFRYGPQSDTFYIAVDG